MKAEAFELYLIRHGVAAERELPLIAEAMTSEGLVTAPRGTTLDEAKVTPDQRTAINQIRERAMGAGAIRCHVLDVREDEEGGEDDDTEQGEWVLRGKQPLTVSNYSRGRCPLFQLQNFFEDSQRQEALKDHENPQGDVTRIKTKIHRILSTLNRLQRLTRAGAVQASLWQSTRLPKAS